VKYKKNLYDKLFWLFDMNNSGVITEKEFIIINNLFKGHTVEEKVKIFFGWCDQEGEGFIDETKLKTLFKKTLSEGGTVTGDELKERARKAAKEVILLVDPYSTNNIKVEEIVNSATANNILKEVIEKNILKFDGQCKNLKKTTGSSFLNNQNMLAHEGIHHVYYDHFVAAIEEKEYYYQNALNMLKSTKEGDKNLKPG
jgi:hypothetical protein